MAVAWRIILLLCLGYSRVQARINESYSEHEERLLSLLLRLQQEEYYDTLLIYGEECSFHSLPRRLDVPAVLVSWGSTNFDWNLSSLTLILICGFPAEREENYRTLMKLQLNRRLIHLQKDIHIESVCDYYATKEQYNIALVREGFGQSGNIYACRCFQQSNYVKVNLYDGKPIFIEQFLNMQGAAIRTLTDSLAPRSMAYRDPKTGQKKFMGYVANALNNFVEKVNATLTWRLELAPQDQRIFFTNITQWATEDLLDIGMSVDSTWDKWNLDTQTYPYLMCSYCFMVPLPDLLPYYEIYTYIVDFDVLFVIFVLFCIFSLLFIYGQQMSWRGLSLARVLLNDRCFRGLLGQPFPFPLQSTKKLKLICFLLCFASLLTTTMYVAYLQAFLATPPPMPMMRSFKDLHNSRYTVAISLLEMDVLGFADNRRLQQVSPEKLEVFDDYRRFVHLRETFNNNYLFPVTDIRWSTYQEQQTVFASPVFYYTDAFCLSRFNFLSFPIRRHLPYRHLFEEHLLRQKEFGLLKHWQDRSFFDMVLLGLASLEDFSPPAETDSIDLHDLSWIFAMYVAALGLCCCCFVLELWGSLGWWRRFKRWTRN
ncbi:hypothetical protein KR054_004635 [Drosophila jambulina]|nr:hypothetical protein KR054_004635 [Drosophila jambulina]